MATSPCSSSLQEGNGYGGICSNPRGSVPGVCKGVRVKNSCQPSPDSHGIMKKIPSFSHPQFPHQ